MAQENGTRPASREIELAGLPSHPESQNSPRSACERIIAHGPPALNEIVFLSAASRLPSGTIVGMEMRSAVGNCVLQLHMPLKPLMQIPSLRNVDRRPIAVRQLFGINVNAGQRSKSSVEGINLVGILLAGLPGPIVGRGRRAPWVRVTTE
jgi:hypothetical protein